jgi:AraC-like DNA-binding protein
MTGKTQMNQRTLNSQTEEFVPCPETLAEWDKLAIDRLFSVEIMAKKCHLSTRQLRRRSVASRGASPSSWMRALRMQQAAVLLLKNLRTKEIAGQLGFKNPSGFCRAFKVFYKLCPKEFYRLHRPRERGVAAQAPVWPVIEIRFVLGRKCDTGHKRFGV